MRNLSFFLLLLASYCEGSTVTNQTFTMQTGDVATIRFDLTSWMNLIRTAFDPNAHLPRTIGLSVISVPPAGAALPGISQPFPDYSFSLEWLDTGGALVASSTLGLIHSSIQSGPATAVMASGYREMTVTQSLADSVFGPVCCTIGQATGMLRLTNTGNPFTFQNLALAPNGQTFIPGTSNGLSVQMRSDLLLNGSETAVGSGFEPLSIELTSVPEPGTLALLAPAALLVIHRRRKQATAQ